MKAAEGNIFEIMSEEASTSQKQLTSSGKKSGQIEESPTGKAVRKAFTAALSNGLDLNLNTENLDKLDAEKLGHVVLDFLRQAQEANSKDDSYGSSKRSNSQERNPSSLSQPLPSTISRTQSRQKGSPFTKHFSERTKSLVRNAAANNSLKSAAASLLSKSVAFSLEHRRNSDSTSSVSAIADIKEEKRQKREIKKRADERLARRKVALERISVISLDSISEPDLPKYLQSEYEKLLTADHIDPQVTYLSLLESLRAYYRNQTWPNYRCKEKCSREFLSRHLVKSKSTLHDEYIRYSPASIDLLSERRIKEHKLQIFLQLGSVLKDSISEIDNERADVIEEVVQKFQLLFFNDREATNTFIKKDLMDEFLTTIPRYLIELMEILDRPLPIELELFLTKEQEAKDRARKKMAAESEKTDRKAEKIGKGKDVKPVKKESPSRLNGFLKNTEEEKMVVKTKKKKDRVPETPCGKQMAPSALRKKRNSLPSVPLEDSLVEDSPVRQSPRYHASTIALKNTGKQSRAEKWQKIYKEQEKRLEKRKSLYSTGPAKRTVKNVPAEGSPKNKKEYLRNLERSTSAKKRGSIRDSPSKTPILKRLGVQHNLCLSLESGQKNSARKNLTRTFSNPGFSGSYREEDSDDEEVEPRRQQPTRSSKRQQPSRPSPFPDDSFEREVIPSTSKRIRGSKKEEKEEEISPPKLEEPVIEKVLVVYELEPEATERYKAHVQKLRSAKYKGKVQEGEVFYGRGSCRVNCFEAEPGTPTMNEKKTILRSNSCESPRTKSPPKNRSGRKVNAASCTVSHVANYLLNVKNENPTSPIIPKVMAQKLRAFGNVTRIPKLNRRPSRSRRIRLHQQALEYARQGELRNEQARGQEEKQKGELKVKIEPKDRLDLEGLLLSPRNNGTNGKNGLTLMLNRITEDSSLDIIPMRRQRSQSDCGDDHPVRRSSRGVGNATESIEESEQEQDGRSRLMSWSISTRSGAEDRKSPRDSGSVKETPADEGNQSCEEDNSWRDAEDEEENGGSASNGGLTSEENSVDGVSGGISAGKRGILEDVKTEEGEPTEKRLRPTEELNGVGSWGIGFTIKLDPGEVF